MAECLVAGVGEGQEHDEHDEHDDLAYRSLRDVATILPVGALTDQLLADEWVIGGFNARLDG